MARKEMQQPAQLPLRLKFPAGEIHQRINGRMEKGQAILQIQISSVEGFERTRNEYHKWFEYNTELLRQVFSNESMAHEYSTWVGYSVSQAQDLPEKIRDFHSDVKESIRRLESISERLELIPLGENVGAALAKTAVKAISKSSRIFIVHGHDDAAREATARFLSKLRLEPIILHEQANEGRTIIEKLEYYSEVGYAVVLLTPVMKEGRRRKVMCFAIEHDRTSSLNSAIL